MYGGIVSHRQSVSASKMFTDSGAGVVVPTRTDTLQDVRSLPNVKGPLRERRSAEDVAGASPMHCSSSAVR